MCELEPWPQAWGRGMCVGSPESSAVVLELLCGLDIRFYLSNDCTTDLMEGTPASSSEANASNWQDRIFVSEKFRIRQKERFGELSRGWDV